MVKDIFDLKALRDMTVFANELAENATRVRILVARNASRNFDGSKLTLAEVAFVARHFLVLPSQRELGFSPMVELHGWTDLHPAVGGMASLAIG